MGESVGSYGLASGRGSARRRRIVIPMLVRKTKKERNPIAVSPSITLESGATRPSHQHDPDDEAGDGDQRADGTDRAQAQLSQDGT